MNINKMIDKIISLEGGFVDHKNDKGGATNYGITQHTYSRFLGVDSDYMYIKHLIKVMPKSTAALIYKQEYYYEPKINLLPELLQEQVFDICVNSGSSRAYKILQQAINEAGGANLVIDGKFGPNSWSALDLVLNDLKEVNNAMVDLRCQFYETIVIKDSSQNVFLKGWLNRARKFYQ